MLSLLTVHRSEFATIARKYGVNRVRVFGSSAADNRHPDSDIDLLVDMEPGRSLLDLIGFKQDLESLLGLPVDVVTEKGLSPYIKDDVLAKAQPLDLRAA